MARGTLALTRLTLSHVRSHRLTRIETDARPVAIYGPNGAGKTNILEAISLLSPGRGLRRAGTDEIARTPEGIGWKIAAELTSLHQVHAVEMTAEPGASGRTVLIDGKTATQTALGRIARVLWLIPAMDRLWIEGASERRRFLDRMAMSLEPRHADAALAYEKAMRERNRLLKDQVRDPGWYRGLEAQLAEQGAAIIANRRLTLERISTAQDDGESRFPKAVLSLADPEDGQTPDDADALADALAAGRARDMAAGRTLVGPHRADLSAVYAAKGVEAKLCSTGEQKALLVSLILANARAIAADFGAAPILLLDEVAAHLDAERRAALYDEVTALGAQAWMTGTGAELFTPLGGRAVWLEVCETADGTRVEPVAPPAG